MKKLTSMSLALVTVLMIAGCSCAPEPEPTPAATADSSPVVTVEPVSTEKIKRSVLQFADGRLGYKTEDGDWWFFEVPDVDFDDSVRNSSSRLATVNSRSNSSTSTVAAGTVGSWSRGSAPSSREVEKAEPKEVEVEQNPEGEPVGEPEVAEAAPAEPAAEVAAEQAPAEVAEPAAEAVEAAPAAESAPDAAADTGSADSSSDSGGGDSGGGE